MPPTIRVLARSIGRACANPGLVLLYVTGFLLMSCFVTIYNYLGFRLLGPEFRLPQTIVGLIFVAYLAGSLSSALAGRLVNRFGRAPLIRGAAGVTLFGLALMLSHQLVLVVLGLLMITIGYFAGHAVASGWVSARSEALAVPGSAVYLLGVYLGSSVGGTGGGLAFGGGGWFAVTGYTATLMSVVLALALVAPRFLSRGDQPSAVR